MPYCPLTLFRRIKNKLERKYVCEVPDCPSIRVPGEQPTFGAESDLRRHNQDVHPIKFHRCPVTACQRHTEPFSRLANLKDHMARRRKYLLNTASDAKLKSY